ncbi:MAG: hypothetical protein ACT4NV_14805 [Rhodoferax sp.]
MSVPLESRIQTAIRDCLDHAKRALYRDVASVAELMGLENKWVLFKWSETGRMPAIAIPAFEEACGSNALSKCLADAGGTLTIPAPTGRLARVTTSAEAHHVTAMAIAKAVSAEIDPSKTDEAVRAINGAIEALAWLRHQLAEKEAVRGQA